MAKFLAVYFSVITDVVFFFSWCERVGGRREEERWNHSVQFVGNFDEPSVRHITFKRLKVGRRVRCSELYTVFVGEKRKEEKRQRRKTTRKEREERKEGLREEEKERRERLHRAHVQHASVCSFNTPPCVPAKRPHVFNMRASCRYTWRRFECTHGGVLDMSTEKARFRAPSRATYHTTTQQHHNTTTPQPPPTQHTTQHVHTTPHVHCTHATTPSVHTRSQHNQQPTVILRRKSECLNMCTAVSRP